MSQESPTPKPGTRARVPGKDTIWCDICTYEDHRPIHPALYDGATTQGPWAFMCGYHFALYGMGLGYGRGQRLIVEK